MNDLVSFCRNSSTSCERRALSKPQIRLLCRWCFESIGIQDPVFDHLAVGEMSIAINNTPLVISHFEAHVVVRRTTEIAWNFRTLLQQHISQKILSRKFSRHQWIEVWAIAQCASFFRLLLCSWLWNSEFRLVNVLHKRAEAPHRIFRMQKIIYPDDRLVSYQVFGWHVFEIVLLSLAGTVGWTAKSQKEKVSTSNEIIQHLRLLLFSSSMISNHHKIDEWRQRDEQKKKKTMTMTRKWCRQTRASTNTIIDYPKCCRIRWLSGLNNNNNRLRAVVDAVCIHIHADIQTVQTFVRCTITTTFHSQSNSNLDHIVAYCVCVYGDGVCVTCDTIRVKSTVNMFPRF